MLISWRMLSLTKGIRKNMLMTAFVTSLSYLVSLYSTYMVVRTIIAINEGLSPFIYLAQMALMLVFSAVLSPIRQRYELMSSADVKHRIRELTMRRLFKLGVLYQEANRTGDLTTTAVMRIEAIGLYFSNYIPNILNVLIVSTGIIIYIATISWQIGLICAVGLLGVLTVPALWYVKIYSKGTEVWRVMSDYRSEFIDNIQGMACLKNLRAQEKRRNEMNAKGRLMHKKTMSNLTVNCVENFFILIFCGLGASISIARAGYLCHRGLMPAETLLLLVFLVPACFVPVYGLISSWHIGYNGLTAMTRIQKIFEEPITSYWDEKGGSGDNSYEKVGAVINSHEKSGAGINSYEKVGSESREPKINSSALGSEGFCVEGLDFTYPKASEKALTNISFDVKKGERVAFVGRSGEGKSTLISILAGVYPYSRGSVSYNGIRLGAGSLDKWLKNIGAIWQSQYIFDGSIRENLLMADSNATEEELWDALDKANLGKHVRGLEHGLDSYLGERGARFSGGERQRLAIARLFIKQPDILILDEATSSLDEENQAEVTESLKRLGEGKTTFIVAHRTSTFKDADRIFYMEKGEIVDSGTHEELLKRCGGYRDIVRESA